ncbi:hypothetical protein TRIUR3_07982 [Triticum urartu]|uniref:mTERF domain-containing protein 1, mitochondrial n=1 Tax=Triticum urartu TaxID=4572 RepID=M8A1J9_TRIUA|nr:hypothetical protein TRIUR3_07982 [Triticum urartu]
MLRLRTCILTHPPSSPATHPVPCLHRLLSAAAPAVSPGSRFAVEDYLVDTCGLTRAQALKASTKLSHLKSPTNPDAVLAFLAGLGLSSADVAALVARDPKFLCAGVERTLSPILAGLTGLGLSRSEIARVASLAPRSFRSRSVVSGLEYYLPLFSSSESLLRGLKKYKYFLSSDPERVVKPNIELLRECGIGTSDIAKLCLAVPWLLSAKPERVQVMLACAKRLGVPRGSGMFRHALKAVESLSEEKLAAKVEYLRNTFRWSDAEVGIALRKAPLMLTKSNQTMQSKSEFLISEMGLEPAYLAHCPKANSSMKGYLAQIKVLSDEITLACAPLSNHEIISYVRSGNGGPYDIKPRSPVVTAATELPARLTKLSFTAASPEKLRYFASHEDELAKLKLNEMGGGVAAATCQGASSGEERRKQPA